MGRSLLHFGPVRRLLEKRGVVIQDKVRCVLCGKCAKSCPMGAILLDRENRSLRIDNSQCVRCGSCVKLCPREALELKKLPVR
ncbi:MAG: 4Fe-4S binding protein [Oscillospiraceae bacterium]|jgi:ech hydrogenase subunit F|nr:4Fe-4S binding protein [Oscillospiraceae bacterium]